jgi:hypothetical protein
MHQPCPEERFETFHRRLCGSLDPYRYVGQELPGNAVVARRLDHPSKPKTRALRGEAVELKE